MELVQLVDAIRVVELTAKNRKAAIRALVRAADLDDDGISLDEVVEAIEEREATAQTIVAEGFALPHAVIDWDGEFRVVLGRSNAGVDCGVPTSGPVKLIALLVIGKRHEHLHLEVLAALAKLLETEDLRQAIIAASDTRAIEQLLRTRAGLTAETRRPPSMPRINTTLVRQAVQLADTLAAQAVLLAVDEVEHVPFDALAPWAGKVLVITAHKSSDAKIERPNTHLFDVPHASLSRMERANLGLLLAASVELLDRRVSVVCVTGPGGRRLDSITVTRPEGQLQAMFGGKTGRRSTTVRPAVILRVLSLAIELAAEGREAKPIGALFVVGDTRRVLRHARQLVLNPFHGFSKSLRSVLDPSLTETIKEFALIDGAFIINREGIVLSAGTYLVPKSTPRLPSGLGTRHQAAAGITADSSAMAITVSQSTGAVSVFRHGSIVLKLEQATQTRW